MKQLRAEVTRLGRDAEKMTASLTDAANIRAETVKWADNLIAQLAASVRRKDAYMLKLAAGKQDLVKTRVERANLL